MDFHYETGTSTQWWDTGKTGSLTLDDLLDDSVFSLYTQDADPNYGVFSPPNTPDQGLGDFFSFPLCMSPAALNSASAPSPLSTNSVISSINAELLDQPNIIDADVEAGQWPSPNSNSNSNSSEKPVQLKQSGLRSNERGGINKIRPSFNSRRASSGDESSSSTSSSSNKLRCFKNSRKQSSTKPSRPCDTEGVRNARHSHNMVEKKYRDHLNQQFECLLAVLMTTKSTMEDSDDDEKSSRTLSKASVLELARRRVQKLEAENQSLNWEVKRLKGSTMSNVMPLTEVMPW